MLSGRRDERHWVGEGGTLKADLETARERKLGFCIFRCVTWVAWVTPPAGNVLPRLRDGRAPQVTHGVDACTSRIVGQARAI